MRSALYGRLEDDSKPKKPKGREDLSMKHLGLLTAFCLAFWCSGSASITEVRHNFFNRRTNLPATAIMQAPVGDASYLISVYESTVSCAIIPTLRWTDENGVTRSQQGTVGPVGPGPGNGNCYLSLVANLRVHAKTAPTVETAGDDNRFVYSLYVFGLGFWPTGAQRQRGLSEVNGTVPNADLVYALPAYAPLSSTSGLLVAYSTGFAGGDVPFLSWTDENGYNSHSVPVGTSVVIPVRIAGSTKVWIQTYPGDTTWYALIIFGAPAKGSGPFVDYEANLLDWTDATYPTLQTLLTAGSAGSNILLLSDVTELANSGTVSEGLQVYWTNQTSVPCAAALTANPTGTPASCVSPVFVGSNSPLEFRTYNTAGNPWGPSPAYSAEVDVLVF